MPHETDDNAATELAIGAITREHQLLEAMLGTLQMLIHDIEHLQSEPDFPLLASELYFIEDFQDGHHHPLEEEYLFKVLRRRAPALIPILDELHTEHARDSAMIAEIDHALVRYHGGAHDGFARFKSAVNRYSATTLGHLRMEATLQEPARACLTTEEWRDMARAFEANGRSLNHCVPRDELQKISHRIMIQLPRKLRYPALRETHLL